MNQKSWFFVMGMGVWTAVTLAGSIFLIFRLPFERIGEQLAPHVSDFLLVLLMAPPVFVVIPAIGGGLWALGMGWFMQVPAKPLMKRGALSWGGTVFLVGLALYFSQYLGAYVDKVAGSVTHYVHYLFTLVFVPGVGLATLLNTRSMTAKLGFDDLKKEVGRKSGLAAASAFLLVSFILLFGFGWEVGRPGYFAGFRYSMIIIMHVCNFGAALAGGLVMGWSIAREQVAEPAFLAKQAGD